VRDTDRCVSLSERGWRVRVTARVVGGQGTGCLFGGPRFAHINSEVCIDSMHIITVLHKAVRIDE
jgi:hypothetical protein